MSDNLDLKKTYKDLYKPSAKGATRVTVPTFNYLMIDGHGNPSTSELYKQAIEALYPLAYGVRAISKSNGITFTVMPLEGLWWWPHNERPHNQQPDNKQSENTGRLERLTTIDKDAFEWTLMILQPEHITAEMVEKARGVVREKKNPARLDDVRFEAYTEGDAFQIMHIGSYDDEVPSVQALHDAIDAGGYELAKKHHEIYLSDPRKTAPEKLKTVIRQPFSLPVAEAAHPTE